MLMIQMASHKHHQEGISDKQIKTKKEDFTLVETNKYDKMGEGF